MSDLAQREVVVAPYRYLYRVKGQVIWIVAVWRNFRLFPKV